MTSNNKVCIFFDTNTLEAWFEKDCLHLSQPRFQSIYYTLEQFIVDYHLENNITLCMSEISIQEIKKHLISCYQSKTTTLQNDINNYKQIFGDLFEISVDKISCACEKDYSEYIENYYNDFFNTKKSFLKIIPYPTDEKTLKNIVHKAMHTIKPFSIANKQNKKYTDAGLKDALIFETIIQESAKSLCILVTKDNDFNDILNETNLNNIRIFDNEDDIKNLLIKYLEINITDHSRVAKILSDDKYFIEKLLEETELSKDANYLFKEIKTIEEVDNGTKIQFISIINGEEYNFDIIYELNANELIEVLYFGVGDE